MTNSLNLWSYAGEKQIYSTKQVPLTNIESNDNNNSFFRSLVSFANPQKENEFILEIEIPESSSWEVFGCAMELHGGLGNFNPSLSKLLEDQNQTKEMVAGFVKKLLDPKISKDKKIEIIS